MTPSQRSNGKTTVGIVDDNRLVREALASILGQLPDLQVVATGAAEATFMEQTKPDVLLLDVGLGDDDSLRIATTLGRAFPATKIIVMDVIPMNEDIVQF